MLLCLPTVSAENPVWDGMTFRRGVLRVTGTFRNPAHPSPQACGAIAADSSRINGGKGLTMAVIL